MTITSHVSGTSVNEFRMKRRRMRVGPEPVSQGRKKSKPESRKDRPRQGGQGRYSSRKEGTRSQKWKRETGVRVQVKTKDTAGEEPRVEGLESEGICLRLYA